MKCRIKTPLIHYSDCSDFLVSFWFVLLFGFWSVMAFWHVLPCCFYLVMAFLLLWLFGSKKSLLFSFVARWLLQAEKQHKPKSHHFKKPKSYTGQKDSNSKSQKATRAKKKQAMTWVAFWLWLFCFLACRALRMSLRKRKFAIKSI